MGAWITSAGLRPWGNMAIFIADRMLPSFTFSPKFRREKSEHRENFKTSQEHREARDSLGEGGKQGIRACRARDAKAGPHAAHGRDGYAHRVNHRDPVKYQEKSKQNVEHHIDEKVARYIEKDLLGKLNPVHGDAVDALRVELLAYEIFHHFEQHDKTRDFESARCGACAAPEKHQHKQHTF